jgi:hypothetical protein
MADVFIDPILQKRLLDQKTKANDETIYDRCGEHTPLNPLVRRPASCRQASFDCSNEMLISLVAN